MKRSSTLLDLDLSFSGCNFARLLNFPLDVACQGKLGFL